MQFIASAVTTGSTGIVLTVDEPRGIQVVKLEVSLEAGTMQADLYRTAVSGSGTVVGNVLSYKHRGSGESVAGPAILRQVGFTSNADQQVGSWFLTANQPLVVKFPKPGLELWPIGDSRWGLALAISTSETTDIAYNFYYED